MRNILIGFSILCFALSGIITFKALNLPEKNPLNPAALSQVKLNKFLHIVKEILTEPDIEQEPLNPPIETLQSTISQPEQKLENESAASQINIQTLENTVKQLEKKLADKIARAQKDTQSTENIAAQLEQKLADKVAGSQTDTQSAENSTIQLEQKLTNENEASQINIQTLQDTVKRLVQKLINKDNASKTDTQTSKNIIAQQEYTPAPLKNVSQSKLNSSEPEKAEKLLTVLLGDVAFSSGEFVINDNIAKLIQQSTQRILSFPNYRVTIEGHTDNIPISKNWQKRYKDNMDLSFFRAKAVARVFEKQGISFKRISVIGYGDTRPIASNDTVDGRAKNRRVVVRLIPEEKEI